MALKTNKILHFLAWTAGILITVIAVALILIALMPKHYIGDTIRTAINTKAGRDVSIDGPVRITWHWTQPRIRIEGLRLANLPGHQDADMLKIDEIDATVKIWKLLAGRTEVPRLKVVRPVLILEKGEDGKANWDFSTVSEAEAVASVALPDERGDMPLIENLSIEDGRLTYKDQAKGLNVSLKVTTAQGTDEGADFSKNGYFQLTGEGMIQKEPFTLEAHGGSLEMLRDTSKAYPLIAQITAGKTKAAIDGTFNDPLQMKGLKADVRMTGGNLADLFYLTGIPLPPTPPYTLAGALSKENDIWHFASFEGKVGGSDLSGDVTYDTGKERSFLSGNLYSEKMDVDDLGGFIGLAPTAKKLAGATEVQKLRKEKQAASPRLFPDVPLDLARLRAVDMDLTLTAKKLNAPGWPLDAMEARFDLQDGLLKIEPLRFGIANGTFDGKLTLDGRQEMPNVILVTRLDRLSLKKFFAGTRFADLSEGRFDGHIDLEGKGKSFAKVLGASDGRITAYMGGGKVSLLIIEAMDLDVAQMTPLLLDRDRATGIRCAGGDFALKNGLLTSEVFVFDTVDTQVTGKLKIDLGAETISGHLDPQPKDSSPLSIQSGVQVTGQLKNPKVAPNLIKTGARGTGAAALGALFLPAAILAFIEPASGENVDCKALSNYVDQAEKAAASPARP